MEQSSWEASSWLAGQEIPRLLWTLKGPYCAHRNHLYAFCILTTSFLRFALKLYSHLSQSSHMIISLKFSNEIVLFISHIPMHATCLTHLIHFSLWMKISGSKIQSLLKLLRLWDIFNRSSSSKGMDILVKMYIEYEVISGLMLYEYTD